MKKDEALYNKGVLLVEQGKLNEAIECFKQAIQFNPQRIECYNDITKRYID